MVVSEIQEIIYVLNNVCVCMLSIRVYDVYIYLTLQSQPEWFICQKLWKYNFQNLVFVGGSNKFNVIYFQQFQCQIWLYFCFFTTKKTECLCLILWTCSSIIADHHYYHICIYMILSLSCLYLFCFSSLCDIWNFLHFLHF